ncbi:MAG: FtsW/RodA/SpoVE family cell cycle protein [Clostridia bacterium]|nr:FtsW/RodA/SpoVE family cell cycle protein [Clostridia bacterium]
MRILNSLKWAPIMILITIFQIFSFSQIVLKKPENLTGILIIAGLFIFIEWFYLFLSTFLFPKSSNALECIAFFLTGISIVISASFSFGLLAKQFAAFIIGIIIYPILLKIMENPDKAEKLRIPFAIGTIITLIITLIFAKNINGAYNWIVIGPLSIQPAELIKVTFIFVGAASLDKIQQKKSLTLYILFSVTTIVLLFLMRDLGTALIFFFTFVVLAFLRSGDIRTIIFICLSAALGAALVVLVRSDYVMRRFAVYRHIWEYPHSGGYQQTRSLIYSASGGLLGLGIGNGKLRNIFAAAEDLIFALVCEEFGILIGFTILFCFVVIAIHSVRNANGARSSFYTIACCSAGFLLLFQVSLNVFGVTDLLPMTGVTLPFVSRGGSSTISCWGLLAFIKAADNRTWLRDISEIRKKMSNA